MIIGSVVYATDQGLGYLAKDFFDNGLINEVFVWRHTSRTNHYEWYPNRKQTLDELMDSIDVLIGFETFFDVSVTAKAKEYGVKIVLVPMYECTPSIFARTANLIINPSDLDQRYYQQGVRLNIPVDVNWRRRERAEVFVHNAGNGGLMGRNGTREILEAMKSVKSPISLIIRYQEGEYTTDDPRITLQKGSVLREELYDEGDIFLFPEKFNGLSLPMQEAFASGMPVMGTKRFPMDRWLPRELLIDPVGFHDEQTFLRFPVADLSTANISAMIDGWYNKDITKYSQAGLEWGLKNSWDNLKPLWRETLEA